MRSVQALSVVVALALAGCHGEEERPDILDPGSDGGARGRPSLRDEDVAGLFGPEETTEACETRLPEAPAREAGALSGGFTRVAAMESSLRAVAAAAYSGRPDSVSATLVADLDGDGRDDLLFNDQRDFCGGAGSQASTAWLSLRGADGALGAPAALTDLSNCQLAADLDGDGRLDLVCARRGANGRAVVWGGDEGLSAARATSIPSPSSVMAVAAWDVDDDGALDLVLSSWGMRSMALRNLGGRRFEDVTERWGVDIEGNTFQVGFFDVDGDGRADLYASDDGDQHQNRALRLVRGDDDVEPRFERVTPTQSACDPEGYFSVSDATAMGFALGDVDGDGGVEVLLATGPFLPLLARRRAPPFNWIDVHQRLGLDQESTTSGSYVVPWTPVFWDMDHDGWLDLWVATGDDFGFSMQPDRGQSRLLVYRGTRGGGFVESSAPLGVTSRGQYGYLQLGDIDDDGDLDVTVGSFGGPPEVYRNDLAGAGRHAVISLRGTVSNPHGLGATLSVGDHPRAYPVGDRWGSWGTAQPVVDVTLPRDPSADSLRVRWPSGCVQTVAGPFTSPRVTVTEPAWLRVDGGSLHAVGGASVRVTVAPSLLGGGASGDVVIDDVGGGAAWAGPTARGDDGAWTRELTAPSAAAVVTLRVRVGDRALPARPRVRFE